MFAKSGNRCEGALHPNMWPPNLPATATDDGKSDHSSVGTYAWFNREDDGSGKSDVLSQSGASDLHQHNGFATYNTKSSAGVSDGSLAAFNRFVAQARSALMSGEAKFEVYSTAKTWHPAMWNEESCCGIYRLIWATGPLMGQVWTLDLSPLDTHTGKPRVSSEAQRSLFPSYGKLFKDEKQKRLSPQPQSARSSPVERDHTCTTLSFAECGQMRTNINSNATSNASTHHQGSCSSAGMTVNCSPKDHLQSFPRPDAKSCVSWRAQSLGSLLFPHSAQMGVNQASSSQKEDYISDSDSVNSSVSPLSRHADLAWLSSQQDTSIPDVSMEKSGALAKMEDTSSDPTQVPMSYDYTESARQFRIAQNLPLEPKWLSDIQHK